MAIPVRKLDPSPFGSRKRAGVENGNSGFCFCACLDNLPLGRTELFNVEEKGLFANDLGFFFFKTALI